jgi:transmembrane 9 superfamily member 2/4
LEVKVPKACEVACVKKLKATEKQAFVRAIDDDYRVHWMVDNLPVGSYVLSTDGEQYFTRGYPVGFTTGTGEKTMKHYLYNHIRIIIQYHDDVDYEILGFDDNPTTKIVGFRVEPMSIRHSWEGSSEFVVGQTVLSTCNAMVTPTNNPANFYSVDKSGESTVVFTYDVHWEKSIIEWSNRWDVYLTTSTPNVKVHWFSISNSIVIVLFLTIMIAMILIRALNKDIAQYNDPTTLEEAKEETGWKLVHGDVFRPPTVQPLLFR